MPKGINGWGWDIVAGSGPMLADIAVAEGDAETADGHGRETGNDRERYALLQGVGGGHALSLPLLIQFSVVGCQFSEAKTDDG